MNHLRGMLDVIGFDGLLQRLAERRAEGFLTVSRAREYRLIHIAPGGLRLISMSAPSQGFLAKAAAGGHPPSLDERIQEEILDVITWEGAAFDFVEGPCPDRALRHPVARVVVDLNVPALLLEAARRRDEMQVIRRLIPSNGIVPARLRPPDSEAWRPIASLADGFRTVGDILAVSPYSRFRTMSVLHGMVRSGNVRLRPPPRVSYDGHRSRGRLLAIGAHVAFRNDLKQKLQHAGFTVHAWAPVHFLLSRFGRREYDAVLMDLRFSLAEEVNYFRDLRRATSCPMLLIATAPKRSDIRTAIRMGARDVVVKPFLFADLVRRIDRTLGRSMRPEAACAVAPPVEANGANA